MKISALTRTIMKAAEGRTISSCKNTTHLSLICACVLVVVTKATVRRTVRLHHK